MADQNQNRKQYTKQGYQELLGELRRRQQEEREKIREDIAVAKSFGDLSENSEYDAARTAQAENEARILELEALIENAIVVDEYALMTAPSDSDPSWYCTMRMRTRRSRTTS